MVEQEIRLASIGYGDIAQRSHFPRLQQLDGAELVAIAGRSRESMEACARRFDIPHVYTDVDAMLARDDIDGVLVLTPPSVHAELAVKAAQAGKAVLIEKPMVTELEAAHRIREAVEASGVVCYPLPHVSAPSYDFLAQLIAAEAIGTVTTVEAHKGHRGPTHAGWFYRRDAAGGGVLFDLGIYGLVALVRVFGTARAMSALCATRYPTRTLADGSQVDVDVEDIAVVNLWHGSGVASVLNANWCSYLDHHHTRSRITLFGREGMIHFGVPGGDIYIHRLDDDYSGLPLEEGPQAAFDGYPCRRLAPPAASSGSASGIMAEFVRRIRQQETSTELLAQQVHVMEIMLTAYELGGLDDLRSLSSALD